MRGVLRQRQTRVEEHIESVHNRRAQNRRVQGLKIEGFKGSK
jgi:hypothetical protein